MLLSIHCFLDASLCRWERSPTFRTTAVIHFRGLRWKEAMDKHEEKIEISIFYLTTPTSNLLWILRSAYGRSAEWTTFIRRVSRQEVATTVVTYNKNTNTKYGNQQIRKPSLSPAGPACRSLRRVLQPGYSSFWMYNLHLRVGDRPAHRLIFAGSFDQMNDCGRSLSHCIICRRMQRSFVRTLLD